MVADHARYRILEGAGHLHVGFLGVHPDVHILPDILDVTGDQADRRVLGALEPELVEFRLADGLAFGFDVQVEYRVDGAILDPAVHAISDDLVNAGLGPLHAPEPGLVVLDDLKPLDVERDRRPLAADQDGDAWG